MASEADHPDRAPCRMGEKLRAHALFLAARTTMRLTGTRRQLRDFAARMERDFCPGKGKQPLGQVELEARESEDGAVLHLSGRTQPLEATDRLAEFLLSVGVRRVELDPTLECNQVTDVFEVLWGLRKTLRTGAPGAMGRLVGLESMAGDLRSPEGLNLSCATSWLDAEEGLLRIKYTYCRTAFSRAVETLKKRDTLFRDHRAFFRAAPRLGLLFAALAALPLVFRLVFVGFPGLLIILDALVVLAVGVTVFALLETLGSLEYDKEHQQNELERGNRLLTEAYNKIQTDASNARNVQRALLPPPGYQPFSDRLSTAFWYEPEMAVGGDYFDLRVLDDERLGILIVDVSGHGMSAAFVTGLVKMALDLSDAASESPAAFMNTVNGALARLTPPDSFATCVYMAYNLKTRRLRFANAGHNPGPVILRAGGETVKLEDPSGIPVGVLDSFRYEDGETAFDRGDRLVLVTDGVTEAMDARKTVWGSEAFAGFLASHASEDAETLCRRLREAVRGHENGAPPNDDQTAAVIGVK